MTKECTPRRRGTRITTPSFCPYSSWELKAVARRAVVILKQPLRSVRKLSRRRQNNWLQVWLGRKGEDSLKIENCSLKIEDYSPAGQWLGLCSPYTEGTGLIPDWGTKIPHAIITPKTKKLQKTTKKTNCMKRIENC